MNRCYGFFLTVIVTGLLVSITAPALAQAPPNDECSGATIIPSLPYADSQNTRLATPNPGDPILFCADSGGGKSVWFKWTADSSGWVTFTTRYSLPADYDVAMGLYTGTCGALSQVDCNDDIVPGSVRQAELTDSVISGTTYIIYIGEWKGGGPNGGVPTGGDLVLDVFWSSQAPLYAGPASGMVTSGATVSTNSFSNKPAAPPLSVMPAEPEGEQEHEAAENRPQVYLPAPKDVMRPLAPAGSNYHEYRPSGIQAAPSQPVVLKSFTGNQPTGFIPPDPIIAVGPNHVIGIVNSSFTIWDKAGNFLKTIDLNSWFNSVKANSGFSDPEVIFDHYTHRWVITGLATATPYALLLSVSDDDNPIGTWTNWSLPSGLGDSVTGNLPDQPQLGYDENAIYITTRDFGSTLFSRVRIINKAQIYKASPDTVRWTDFWDIREPQHRTIAPDRIRPSIEYNSPGVHFLVAAAPYDPGTFFSVYTIHDPIGSPYITGVNIPVVQYVVAPQASQLGAGTPIETDASSVSHRAIYRDSSLWIAHSIASGSGNAFSAVHYVRFNPWASTNLEDVAMGSTGYWHFYTALVVDGNDNVLITYNRSSNSDFIGAFVAGHRASDPPGLSPSILLKPGTSNYDITANGRNRWGDYNGIYLDPVDSSVAWVNTEIPTPGNWTTSIGEIKMAPVAGRLLYAFNPALSFGQVEVGFVGDTQTVTLTNFGTDSLTITGLTATDTNYEFLNAPSFPMTLATYDSAKFSFRFVPKSYGLHPDTISILSNDSFNSSTPIALTGNGFIIHTAQTGAIYSCNSPDGNLFTVDHFSAGTSLVGATGYGQMQHIRIRPSNHEIVGLATSGTSMQVLRVNSTLGDAHPVSVIPLTVIKGMALRNDTMYVGRLSGGLYRVDMPTGTSTLLSNTGLVISAMDFNPVTGVLWIAGRPIAGGNNDRIYKYPLPSGPATLVGSTGFVVSTTELAFDAAGDLFGIITPGGLNPNKLILIDTSNGAGTIVGFMGQTNMTGIAIGSGESFYTERYTLAADWNLMSLPIAMPATAMTNVFTTASSRAFYYEGGYVGHDTVKHGNGFWLKFSAPFAGTFVGAPIYNDTVTVSKKWNIVGSLAQPIAASQVGSSPGGIITTNFYSYNGGYSVADSILPGVGYWVRVNNDGRLFYTASGAMPKSGPADDDVLSLQRANSITISDGQGHKQTLYFDRQGDQSPDLTRFDLPPLPPEGSFDARFASNRLYELYPAKLQSTAEYPIELQSVSPVSISWHIGAADGLKFALQAVDGKTSSTSRMINGDGTWKPGGVPTGLNLRIGQNLLPTEFALHQNFPNPFNPSTIIRYDLPSDEHVTLIVYDVLGKVVARLVDGKQAAGSYEIPFSGTSFASGVYFYRLTAGTFTGVQKMMLMK